MLALGHALVDVIAHTDDEQIAHLGLVKGAMTLVDEGQADALYRAMPPAVESSGGSAANTAVGVASLGGRAAYMGKVAEDEMGEVFRHDIRAAGVYYAVPADTEGTTGRSLILVTPDAHRTMSTFLGASSGLAPADVDADLVASCAVTFLEGYLWDSPRAKAACLRAIEIAHGAGRKIALTLADPYCVERHREEFRTLIADHVDVLLANADEIMALYEVATFEDAVTRTTGARHIAALTRSEHGSVIVSAGEVLSIAAHPVERVVDTTGAGDMYAAGFLLGIARGEPLERSAHIASIAAAEVIGHFGARPESDLAAIVAAVTPA